MTAAVHALLRQREVSVPALLLVAVASSAAFGAAVGAYVGRFQILFAAVKMPVYFLGTLVISFAALHLLGARDLDARATFAAALETVALTALVLGALAPVVALISLSAPPRRARAYAALILLLTAGVAAGGIAGVGRLHARLRSWRLTGAWIAIYQFVGAQMAWLLKPWIGHTFVDDRFLPIRENLKGNFYESLFHTAASLLRSEGD